MTLQEDVIRLARDEEVSVEEAREMFVMAFKVHSAYFHAYQMALDDVRLDRLPEELTDEAIKKHLNNHIREWAEENL